jgi:hypothetical protein
MHNHRLVRLALAVAALAGTAGCWFNSQRLETFIESQGSKPGWVNASDDTFKQGDVVVFKAAAQRQKDLQLGVQAARAQAMGMITMSIQSSVESAFAVSSSVRSNDVEERDRAGSSLLNEISQVCKATRLTGATPKESYWEKVEYLTRDGDRTIGYNVWATVAIAERDLKRARLAAEERAMGIATSRKDDEAKARLTDSIQKLKDELAQ